MIVFTLATNWPMKSHELSHSPPNFFSPLKSILLPVPCRDLPQLQIPNCNSLLILNKAFPPPPREVTCSLRFRLTPISNLDETGGLDGKESACNTGDPGSIPGSGRSPGVRSHSSILAWRIPWTEEPGGLQSMGSQRVEHDWVTKNLTDLGFRVSIWTGRFWGYWDGMNIFFMWEGYELWVARGRMLWSQSLCLSKILYVKSSKRWW